MIRRTIPRTRAASCKLRLWSFPPRTCFLISLKLLVTEPARKVRKSSRVGFHPSILTAFNYHNLHMEQSYELIVAVTLKRLINGYDVRTEVQSGNGRTDIVMFSGDADNPGIVIELKRAGRPEDLDHAVDEAIS